MTTFGGATQAPNTGTTATATGTITTAYDANFTTVTDQACRLTTFSGNLGDNTTRT